MQLRGKKADQILGAAFLITVGVYVWQGVLPGPALPAMAGTWQGTFGERDERVVILLHLDKTAAPPWVTVVSLDGRRVETFAAADFRAESDMIRFSLPDLRASYEGRLRPDGTLAGRLKNHDTVLSLILTRAEPHATTPEGVATTAPLQQDYRLQDEGRSVPS